MRRTLDKHSFPPTVNDARSVAYLAILDLKQSYVSKCKRHGSNLRSDPPEGGTGPFGSFGFHEYKVRYCTEHFNSSFQELEQSAGL
jgi:hypothetical protein